MAIVYRVHVYNRSTSSWIGYRKFTIPDFSLWQQQVNVGSTSIGGKTQGEASATICTQFPTIPSFGSCDLIFNPTDTGPEIGVPGSFTAATNHNFNLYLGAHGFSIETVSDINDLSFYFDDHRNIRFHYTRYTSASRDGYYCDRIDYCFDNSVIFSQTWSVYFTFACTIPWIAPKINRLVACHPSWYINTYNLENNSMMYMSWTEITHLQTLSSAAIDWFNNMTPTIVDTDNPYVDGGTSNEGGGGGNFSEDSDDVDPDNLPSLSVVGTGMATIFKPSVGELRNLANVMWNSNFFTFMQNLVENISDMFTSLAIVPFDVTAGSTVSVTWLGFDTAVSLTLAAQQYYEFDMGTINLADDSRIYTSGSALDYSPFSRLGIFLPFIGYQELDVDECRNASINLKYRIDILSGSCVALLSVAGNTIYQFTGNCLSQIPITSENMQGLVSDAVNIGIAAASAKANYAVGAAMEEGAAVKEAKEAGSGALEHAHAKSHVANARNSLVSASANAVVGMKPGFAKSGAVGASAALLAVKQPYLFLTTPRQAIPDHYQKYCGFPSNITGKLSEFRGFTVVEDIRLNGLVATSPEVAEIYDLLKKGVII